MKNTICAAIALAVTPMLANAASKNCCSNAPCALTGGDVTYDISCTTTSSCTCTPTTRDNLYGITVTTTNSQKVYCLGNTAYSKCESLTTTYTCASGYYGTATSASAGCTACPDNATCDGGNGSTFKCDVGYYKNGTACTRCPSSGGVYGTTAAIGATDITECYLPSGTTFSDTGGSGTYTGNCHYAK